LPLIPHDIKSKAKVDAAAKEIMAVFDYAPSDTNNTTVYVYNPWGASANGDNYSSPFVVDIAVVVGGPQGLDLWLSNPILY